MERFRSAELLPSSAEEGSSSTARENTEIGAAENISLNEEENDGTLIVKSEGWTTVRQDQQITKFADEGSMCVGTPCKLYCLPLDIIEPIDYGNSQKTPHAVP